MSGSWPAKVFYFGCYEQAGHYMRASYRPKDLEEHRAISHFTETNPWGIQIDGGLCKKGESEGVASLNHKDGWTAMSFWDYSVDRRGGSNSNFLAQGTFTFEQMVEIANVTFPEIVARYNFSIRAGKP